MLRGFIVSDAHFGSDNRDQPTPAVQSEMMRVILQRFTKLDIVIDTGDAHHAQIPGPNGKAKARANWLNRIAGQSPSPFFYVPGNHELSMGFADPEAIACDLGSLSCRPYYSFTVKGIHFISLPQLVKTILVSQETLEWLRLDLAVHRNETVIVLAHNSVAGTTHTDGVTSYREILNTPELLSILDSHPNVIAWMHGHNHQYEIVERSNRIYVSNGRIGGFNPPASWGHFGQGHLGGIYFEVSRKGMLVRAFSASRGRYLDEIGFPNLSLTRAVPTSFNSIRQPSLCIGRGAARDGMRDVLHHHHVAEANAATAYLMQREAQPLNENWNLALETRLQRLKPKNKLIGVRVDPGECWRGLDQAIEVLPEASGKPVVVSIPKSAHLNATSPRRASYLPCKPGGRYRLQLELNGGSGGPTIDLQFQLRRIDMAIVGKWSVGKLVVAPGLASHTAEFNVPSRTALNEEVHAEFQLLVFMTIHNLREPLRFESIRLLQSGTEQKAAGTLKFAEHVVKLDGASAMQSFSFSTLPRNTTRTELICHHSQQVSWLVKYEQLSWQVRNATVSGNSDKLSLQIRNRYVPKEEIVIAPFGDHVSAYISRLANVAEANVVGMALGHRLTVVITEAVDAARPSTIEVRTDRLPANARELEVAKLLDGVMSMNVKVGVPITLDFPVSG